MGTWQEEHELFRNVKKCQTGSHVGDSSTFQSVGARNSIPKKGPGCATEMVIKLSSVLSREGRKIFSLLEATKAQ